MAYSIAVTGEGGSNRVESAGNERVLETFLSLKQDNSSYELKRIGSNYYVYLSSGRLDRNTGRMRKISIYRGRINPDGTFVPIKRKRNVVLNRPAHACGDYAPAEIGAGATAAAAGARQDPNKYEKAILTALSMNGRISMPALSRMIGLSVNATIWQVRNVERKYGIRYLPEMDVGKFGYMQFLITVKFIGNAPLAEEIRVLMSSDPRAQFAMLTKGDADLLMYVLAKTVEEAGNVVVCLRNTLSSYDSIWNMMPVYEDYGFVPLRNEFIELLKSKGELLKREYAVLKELNSDGSTDFSDIDKKYGFDKGRASYSYYKLRKEGKIRRMTITMQKTPMKYIGVVLMTIVSKTKFLEHKAAGLSHIIEEGKMPTDKYLAVYDTPSPDGTILFMPVYEYDDFDKTLAEIQKQDLGMKLTTLLVSNTLFGNCCCRHFDNTYSRQQEVLEKEYKAQIAARIDYETTGRKRAEENVRLDIRGARIAKEEEISGIRP
jgi:DNA-binding Lrp family transcriptional regulator